MTNARPESLRESQFHNDSCLQNLPLSLKSVSASYKASLHPDKFVKSRLKISVFIKYTFLNVREGGKKSLSWDSCKIALLRNTPVYKNHDDAECLWVRCMDHGKRTKEVPLC